MGISRDSAHKRRLTGGKRKIHRKKRKFEMGRQPSATKIGPKRIHQVRTRGGNQKLRALRLETGNFSWATESATKKTRILGVSYNATINELVRTNTLVKGSIVQIDGTPFKLWFEKFYTTTLGKKKAVKPGEEGETKKEEKPVEKKDEKKTTTGDKKKKRHSTSHKKSHRVHDKKIDHQLEEQFNTGRLYAKITSRPGQHGRADGYILEGEELGFYIRKIQARKKGANK